MIGPYVRVECVVLTAFERLPCQDRFAGSVHRFNRFLESLRRGGDAKLAVRARNIAPMIPAINVACLCALAAYADPIRFSSITKITDIDIVIASRKLAAGMDPSAMLPVPVLALSAKAPYAVLLLPLGLLRRALTLIAVLSSPMSLLRSGLSVDCNVCLLRGGGTTAPACGKSITNPNMSTTGIANRFVFIVKCYKNSPNVSR